MSRNGVHCGLRLPVNIDAISHARWPTVWPAASTTYHFLFPARSLPLGKYVDIVNYLYFKRLERERLEYRSLLSIVKPDILHGSDPIGHYHLRPYEADSIRTPRVLIRRQSQQQKGSRHRCR